MANYPVIVLCHALAVSTSGYYDWRERLERPARRRMFVEFLTEQIREVHTQSRGTYGSPRVHAELVLGEGIHVAEKSVERLMRKAGSRDSIDARSTSRPGEIPKRLSQMTS